MEEWRPIPDYYGFYEVSDLCRIRSVDRQVKNSLGITYNRKGKILRPNRNGDVNLSINGNYKTVDCKTVYMMVFNGFKPKGDRKQCVLGNGVVTRRVMNQCIRRKKNKQSPYSGVSLNKKHTAWRASIKINNRFIYLGEFKYEREAHAMYRKAEKNIHLFKGVNKAFRLLLKMKEE